MSDMEAGRELDSLIAERVMGVNLTPPRGFALAAIGATETSVTGKDWRLRNGKVVYVPDGETLKQPEGTTDYNARYFAYVAENGVNDLEQKVAACRLPPKPYSTDIAAAWEVVEKMGDAFDGLYPSFDDGRLCYWVAVTDLSPRQPRRGHIADTAPLAICRAALAVAADVPQ